MKIMLMRIISFKIISNDELWFIVGLFIRLKYFWEFCWFKPYCLTYITYHDSLLTEEWWISWGYLSVLTVFVLVLTVNTNTFFVTEHRQRGHWIKFETASRVRYILLTAALVTVLAGIKLGGTCVSKLHKLRMLDYFQILGLGLLNQTCFKNTRGDSLKHFQQSSLDESLLLSHIKSQLRFYQRHFQVLLSMVRLFSWICKVL